MLEQHWLYTLRGWASRLSISVADCGESNGKVSACTMNQVRKE